MVGSRYSPFRLPASCLSRNSANPLSKIPKNSGVSPHIFIETGVSALMISSFPSAKTAAPVSVFTILEVSTILVSIWFSSTLQTPRVTPPFSLNVFLRTKPTMLICILSDFSSSFVNSRKASA